MSKARQIIELMQPFVEEGRLLERSYEKIDSCIDDFVCIEKDNQIIACAGLKLYQDENVGEIYALVVNKSFHNTDTSTRLMELLIDKASKLNLSSIFALSKYGGRFFFRFEFVESELSFLPDSRQKSYDDIRKSIIYSRRI
ncbi:GNAT family N-acetyltransferase [Candidatus Pseudothioglobus singularis]|nr:GNAT family N-acetyltransferase [Candidatus Pseudothioglobus singularis]MDB4847326.1 GNAT family N-acetyltransferase [Candidatus Pseudothioglobus singularis]